MCRCRYSGPPDGSRKGAFTLIEIIVAMTIITVIAAVAVPTLKGLNREEQVRAPLAALAEMVQEVRQRAMHGHRPYEIIFERDGLHAIPGNRSFTRRDEFLKHLEELRTPPRISGIERETIKTTVVEEALAGTAPGLKPMASPAPGSTAVAEKPKASEMPWTRSIGMTGGLVCAVLMWGDGEWDVLEGDRMRRWVFQANGMASPAQVRLSTVGTELEAGFDILTGEMTGERSRPIPATALR